MDSRRLPFQVSIVYLSLSSFGGEALLSPLLFVIWKTFLHLWLLFVNNKIALSQVHFNCEQVGDGFIPCNSVCIIVPSAITIYLSALADKGY